MAVVPPIPMPRPASRMPASPWWQQPQFTSFASDALSDLAYGLTSGKNLNEGFQQATQRSLAMQDPREKEREQLQQLNQTIEWMRSEGMEALARAAEANPTMMPQLYTEALRQKFGTGDGFTLGPGETRYGADGEVLATVAPAADDPTSDIQNYDFYRQHETAAGREPLSMFEWQQQKARAGATNIDFNQNQGVAAGFADRMAASEQILSDPKIEAALTSVEEDLKRQAPFGMDNFLVSKEYQMADQAKRDFINAILRRESGAVISPTEFANAEKQYFPRPGDSPEVILQKKRNRQIALEGVKRAAGPNYAAPALVPGGVSDPYEKYGLER
jgi:hypothetical protein